jgi:hypothetical protein
MRALRANRHRVMYVVGTCFALGGIALGVSVLMAPPLRDASWIPAVAQVERIQPSPLSRKTIPAVSLDVSYDTESGRTRTRVSIIGARVSPWFESTPPREVSIRYASNRPSVAYVEGQLVPVDHRALMLAFGGITCAMGVFGGLLARRNRPRESE